MPSDTAFTIEAWVRTTATDGGIIETYSAEPVGADRALYVEEGKPCFYVYAVDPTSVCSTAAVNDGAWHHLAGTLGAGGQKLFVDGALVAEDAAITESVFDYEKVVRMGIAYLGIGSTPTRFVGDLDEVRLWNVERTAAELAAARSATIAPTTTGLYGYWRFDDAATATTAASARGDGFDGVMTGFSGTYFVPGVL